MFNNVHDNITDFEICGSIKNKHKDVNTLRRRYFINKKTYHYIKKSYNMAKKGFLARVSLKGVPLLKNYFLP